MDIIGPLYVKYILPSTIIPEEASTLYSSDLGPHHSLRVTYQCRGNIIADLECLQLRTLFEKRNRWRAVFVLPPRKLPGIPHSIEKKLASEL